MEKIPWVQLPAPKESESPLELYLEMYHLIAVASHYICAPITSPAGLSIEARNVQEIKKLNWERNVATLVALMQSKAFDASLVYMPAVIGLRVMEDEPWTELDFNIFNTLVFLRIPPERASHFVSKMQFTPEELGVFTNYSDQGSSRETMYVRLGEKALQAINETPINPMAVIAMNEFTRSFGCRYELRLAKAIQMLVHYAKRDNENIQLVKQE